MKQHDQDVYLVDGMRTPIGSPYKGLKDMTASAMAAAVIDQVLARNKINKKNVSEVILGNVVSAGLGQNFARQAAYLAQLPETTLAYSVNSVCGSGMQSIILAQQSIRSGNGSLVLAGGAESATHAPNLISKDDRQMRNKEPIDSIIYDGLWCLMSGKHMGELCEDIAQTNQISRKEQDEYTVLSHKKACSAQKEGRFVQEMIVMNGQFDMDCIKDDRPRKSMNLNKLEILPAAFVQEGTITSGNSSVPCDGASMVLVASEDAVRQQGLKARAKIVGYKSIFDKPELVFQAGITAINECLRKCHLSINDIDIFEISEAFAAQAILMKKKCNIPEEKMNVFGGDLALGHPLGAVGSRIVVTLMHALINQNKKRGLACVCLGGGGAVAMIIEKV